MCNLPCVIVVKGGISTSNPTPKLTASPIFVRAAPNSPDTTASSRASIELTVPSQTYSSRIYYFYAEILSNLEVRDRTDP